MEERRSRKSLPPTTQWGSGPQSEVKSCLYIAFVNPHVPYVPEMIDELTLVEEPNAKANNPQSMFDNGQEDVLKDNIGTDDDEKGGNRL